MPQDVIQPSLREKFFDSEGTEPLIVRAEHSDREFGYRKALLVRGVGSAGLVMQGEAEINGLAIAFYSPSILTERPIPCTTCFGGPQLPILVSDQVACFLEGVNEIRARSFLTKSSGDFFACDIVQGLADRSDSTVSNEADTDNFPSHAALDLARFRSPLSFIIEHYFTSVDSHPSRRWAVEAKGAV